MEEGDRENGVMLLQGKLDKWVLGLDILRIPVSSRSLQTSAAAPLRQVPREPGRGRGFPLRDSYRRPTP